MHNGYFSSLAMIVHFYNTRDVLPRCTGTAGIGVTCWPAPEVAANEDRVIGNLGLSASEETEIVDFLGTLTDGYTP
jgi:cytochrome c peroxidase